jgi:2-oxoglutarate ferredoxin oxidoreductase subunit gamma
MRHDVRIAGFGGQGVILAGFIVGKAACVFGDYNAVQSQSYGPEARGGAARSEVIISDERIGYPRPTSCDLFVAMAQEAFDTYRDDLHDKTVIIIDQDLIPNHDIGRPLYKVRAQKIAEDLGNRIVTNIAMVGIMTGIYDLFDKEAMKKSVIDSVPKRFTQLNIDAFENGYEAGKNAREE